MSCDAGPLSSSHDAAAKFRPIVWNGFLIQAGPFNRQEALIEDVKAVLQTMKGVGWTIAPEPKNTSRKKPKPPPKPKKPKSEPEPNLF